MRIVHRVAPKCHVDSTRIAIDSWHEGLSQRISCALQIVFTANYQFSLSAIASIDTPPLS